MMNFKFRIIFISFMSGFSILAAYPAISATLVDNDIATMSTANPIQAQLYFKSHSFDFPKIFSAYHPGPDWILKKKMILI